MGNGLLVLNGKEGETICVLVVALMDALQEEQDRRSDEDEAHKYLQEKRFHISIMPCAGARRGQPPMRMFEL